VPHNKQLQRTVMHKLPRHVRQCAAAELRRTSLKSIGGVLRAFLFFSTILVSISSSASNEALVGRWENDLDGVRSYWTFFDCGVLEINALGSGVQLSYRIKAAGPPLKLELCPRKENTSVCGSIYVYVLGSESLQLIPDTDEPHKAGVPLTDIVLHRISADPGEEYCKPEPGAE
jgi:hypothetical protein